MNRTLLHTRLLATTALLGALVWPTTAPPAAHAATPAYGIATSLTQVRPSTPVTGMPLAASLTAARNETESFQVVVPGGTTVQSLSGDLFGWGTTDVFAARSYAAVNASDREGGTGPWFDALIPAKDHIYGETRTAFPLTAPAGESRLMWVDVTIPVSVAAGTYTSALTLVTTTGTASIPVTLRVVDATLPTQNSVTSTFLMNYQSGNDDQICLAHTGSATCNGSAATRRLLYSLYSRTALDNRFTIANGSGLRADQSPTAIGTAWESDIEGPTILGTSSLPAGARWRLPGAKATSVMQYEYASWHCGAACVGQWKAEATEAGQDWSGIYSHMACDEPGGSAAAWAACGAPASTAYQTWQRPTVVTASLQQYNTYGPASGLPPITTLVSYIAYIHPKGGADARPSYDGYLATPGNRLWLYTACQAAACGSPDPTVDNSAAFDGWPSYAIDAPANQARAMGWMMRRYRASGELNWAVQTRLSTAWQAGGLYWDGMNGDGTLFYPGTPAVIGGTHDIPLTSIRVKRLRDGREDYELMAWLGARGKDAAVDTIVRAAYPTASSALAAADDRPGQVGVVSAARQQLLDLVVPAPASTRIAFASTRNGNYDIFTMNPDGSGVTPLTTSQAADRFPAWKPGAAALAWTAGNDVWTMKADGTSKVNLTRDTSDIAQRPAWDASGTSIVFVRKVAGHWELWRMNADGSAKSALVTFAANGKEAYDPVVSGGTVWFSLGGRLATVPLTGGTPTLLAGGSTIDEVPDVGQTRTTFSRSTGGPYDIIVSDRAGGGARSITATATGGANVNDLHSSLSPDESQIVFASDSGGDLEIWRIGADGTGAVALTTNAAVDTDPDWATS